MVRYFAQGIPFKSEMRYIENQRDCIKAQVKSEYMMGHMEKTSYLSTMQKRKPLIQSAKEIILIDPVR